jgi:hypothetical protein
MKEPSVPVTYLKNLKEPALFMKELAVIEAIN